LLDWVVPAMTEIIGPPTALRSIIRTMLLPLSAT
jgi:hypothetical protein